ncbi:hypothetical protein [Streptomyces sp. ISL-100]|uniref:hypothetical protein n=1 Tax=Streptomyces sp. ISL-100 TaxID=2819173 RepID=UPI0027E56628|nr:hypothetical protein [Streptomyces sp. ISL-100]
MTTPDFRPTHVVPQGGLPAWEAPDVSRPTEPLDPLLPVQLIGRRGDWGQILCANGWSAWVDGRLLVSVPQDPPVAGQPGARTADPRPLLARVEESLSQYRRAVEDLTAGRTDGEGFRRRTPGLRVGVVVEGESVWLYDAEHERWVYCDGTHLITYATSSSPGNSGPPPREPTQVAARPPADPPEPPAAGPEPTQVVASAAPDASRATPPDPTQVVTPPTNDHAPPPAPTQAVGRAPNGPPHNGRAAASDPTRVVADDPNRPPDNGSSTPREPTRVAADDPNRPPDNGSSTPREPTRVVADDPNRPPDNGSSTPPEPTRVVADAPNGPPGSGEPAPPDPARVVSGRPAHAADAGGDDASGGEPTRVVTAEPSELPHNGRAAPPDSTRVVADDPGEPSDNGPTAAPEPTRVVDGGSARSDEGRGDDARGGEPTRVVEPGERAAPHPPTRPGDG